jgi:uncharacterized membrane protein YjjP (DUF1212 family)
VNSTPHDPELAERAELTILFGRLLFRYGASTQRIIDSMETLHARLGGDRLEVLVAYDAITITSFAGDASCTRLDASREPAGVNKHGLRELRILLLENPAQPLTIDHVRSRLREIASAPDLLRPFPWKWLAAAVASAGFCSFNGGDNAALVIAALASIVIYALRLEFLRRKFSIYVSTLFAVAAGGMVATLLARSGWTATAEIALVASTLFLIPGIPMINGGIDIARNHNSMGLARIAFTVALTSTIVLGLALSLAVIFDIPGLNADHPTKMASPAWLGAIWGALAAGALALLNNSRSYAILACALCGATARLTRDLGTSFGMHAATATLIAAVLTTLLAIQLSQRRFLPAPVIAVMGCLTLIPGFYAITGIRGIFELSVGGPAESWQDALFGLQMLLQALFISISIVAGIVFTSMAVDRDARRV